MTVPAALRGVVLTAGAHPDGGGCCAMEAAARLAGEEHSSAPAAVARMLRLYVPHVNDALPDNDRQALLELLPAMIETGRETDHVVRDMNRRYVLLDYAFRRFLPIELERLGLGRAGMPLMGLPVVRSTATWGAGYRELQAMLEKAEQEPAHPTLRSVLQGATQLMGVEQLDDGVLHLFAAINLCFEGPTLRPAVVAVLDCTKAMIAPQVSRRGWA